MRSSGLEVHARLATPSLRNHHALVRQTLYEQLSRVRLHARVAEARVGRYGPDDPEHTLELAQHQWAAIPVTGADAALPWVLAAADHAMARLAYEQAEQQLRRVQRMLSAKASRTARRSARKASRE